MYATRLRCIGCGTEYPLLPYYTCPGCDGLLDVCYDYQALKDHLQQRTEAFSGELLLPVAPQKLISLGEGRTPLVKANRLAQRLGLKNLWLKCESANPTGSFKDRPISVGVSKAVEFGFRQVVVASSGNAAAAVAAYCARAGLAATILVPESTPAEKVKQTAAYGARVLKVPGPYSQSFHRAKEMADREQMFNLTTTFLNPYTVEGDKMIAFELWEQMNRSGPDVICVPFGAGPVLAGIWKGFVELRELGMANVLPRIAGIQAAGCNPVARAFQAGRSIVEPQTAPRTIAGGIGDGLDGYAQDGTYTLQKIRESSGFALDVSDRQILEAQAWLAKDEGILAEPSAAAGVAGLAKSLQTGQIGNRETVAVILTGNGLKDLASFDVMLENK
ncbi:threonine synthase [Brevibacillus massiliensis]|jgi:threonine synthase|uniref:threonine synthase n=1 Tax=Brevibacillus massiliensis TaxID=1118054 RepID=UPI0003142F66|nr:threonine synthase [Brevibacillus massiliensis]